MQYISVVKGQVYKNHNGSMYLCTDSGYSLDDKPSEFASFERLSDGWTLTAHGIVQHENGDIEWNYSTGGYWKNRRAS